MATDMEGRLTSLEKGMIEMEAVLKSNTKTLEKIQESLTTLTQIQIERAHDKAEFIARVNDCKAAADRAHARLDKLDSSIGRIIVAMVVGFIGALVSAVWGTK